MFSLAMSHQALIKKAYLNRNRKMAAHRQPIKLVISKYLCPEPFFSFDSDTQTLLYEKRNNLMQLNNVGFYKGVV